MELLIRGYKKQFIGYVLAVKLDGPDKVRGIERSARTGQECLKKAQEKVKSPILAQVIKKLSEGSLGKDIENERTFIFRAPIENE